MDEKSKKYRRRSRSPQRPRKRSRTPDRSPQRPRKRSRSPDRSRSRKDNLQVEIKRERYSPDEYRRKRRSRTPDRSRSRKDRYQAEEQVSSASSAREDNQLVEITSALPPHLRGQFVAQSLLVKPEALPKVIDEVKKMSAEVQGPTSLALTPISKREKKSRWSNSKAFVQGMPTVLPSDLNDTQLKCYLLQMEIEQATQQLRSNSFSVPEGVERSPSPEPTYDANGKRLNVREVRKKQELEQLRHEKVRELSKLNPAYKPPPDYRPPSVRLHDKVWIPQEENPHINFIGLLIGPRGNTLKALEQETNTKIIIRGRGSKMSNKLTMGPMPGDDEPLHAYVTGTDREIIEKSCTRIRDIINAALLPGGQNAMLQIQLRQLAMLNGTVRPEDIMNVNRCSNCGSNEHKSWECPELSNFTANLICPICGSGGHLPKDCLALTSGNVPIKPFDAEYASLMWILGEKPQFPFPPEQL